MKLVLRTTSVFDENFKMQIRNVPTLFWYMLYRVFHFGQQVHFVQQSTALVISPNATLVTSDGRRQTAWGSMGRVRACSFRY